jgi:hypothetical protein
MMNNYTPAPDDSDLSGFLSKQPHRSSVKTPQPDVAPPSFKDEDLSGCLSGFLKPKRTAVIEPKRQPIEPSKPKIEIDDTNPGSDWFYTN